MTSTDEPPLDVNPDDPDRVRDTLLAEGFTPFRTLGAPGFRILDLRAAVEQTETAPPGQVLVLWHSASGPDHETAALAAMHSALTAGRFAVRSVAVARRGSAGPGRAALAVLAPHTATAHDTAPPLAPVDLPPGSLYEMTTTVGRLLERVAIGVTAETVTSAVAAARRAHMTVFQRPGDGAVRIGAATYWLHRTTEVPLRPDAAGRIRVPEPHRTWHHEVSADGQRWRPASAAEPVSRDDLEHYLTSAHALGTTFLHDTALHTVTGRLFARWSAVHPAWSRWTSTDPCGDARGCPAISRTSWRSA